MTPYESLLSEAEAYDRALLRLQALQRELKTLSESIAAREHALTEAKSIAVFEGKKEPVDAELDRDRRRVAEIEAMLPNVSKRVESAAAPIYSAVAVVHHKELHKAAQEAERREEQEFKAIEQALDAWFERVVALCGSQRAHKAVIPKMFQDRAMRLGQQIMQRIVKPDTVGAAARRAEQMNFPRPEGKLLSPVVKSSRELIERWT